MSERHNDTMTARAYAKINPVLRVGAPFPGGPHAGYHPVCTWMHAVDLFDTITLERAAATSLVTRWEDGSEASWDPEQDLVMRALRALECASGRGLTTRIGVTKRIPDGAGLGGGSSDAASTLVALRALHEIDISDDALLEIGSTLGADVAFFVDPARLSENKPPRPAIAMGFGERIERVPQTQGILALVLPPFGCPTSEVYAAFDALIGHDRTIDEDAVRDAALEGTLVIDGSRNDLVDAARRVRPELDAMIRAIEGAGVDVMMSGSGSALVVKDAAKLPDLQGARVIGTRLV